MFTGLVIFSLNYRRFAKADEGPDGTDGQRESLKPFWLQCLLPLPRRHRLVLY